MVFFENQHFKDYIFYFHFLLSHQIRLSLSNISAFCQTFFIPFKNWKWKMPTKNSTMYAFLNKYFFHFDENLIFIICSGTREWLQIIHMLSEGSDFFLQQKFRILFSVNAFFNFQHFNNYTIGFSILILLFEK